MGTHEKTAEEKLATRQAANHRYRHKKIDAGMRPVTIWTHFLRTQLPDNQQYLLCKSSGEIPAEVAAGKLGVKIFWENGKPHACLIQTKPLK